MKYSFDYDPQKNARNVRKHGINFDEAQALWEKRIVEVLAKTEDGEIRYANIGKIGNMLLDNDCYLSRRSETDHFGLSFDF